MDVKEAIEKRRAYRALGPAEITDGLMNELADAARLTASCFNNQPWRLVAVTGEKLEALRATLTEGNKWATRAPLIVAFATKPSLEGDLFVRREFEIEGPSVLGYRTNGLGDFGGRRAGIGGDDPGAPLHHGANQRRIADHEFRKGRTAEEHGAEIFHMASLTRRWPRLRNQV